MPAASTPGISAYAGGVTRWTGTWLSGPGAAAEGDQRWRGERIGLPESGPGSVAAPGRRLAALLIDVVLASLVTRAFYQPDLEDPAVMWTYNLLGVGVWSAIAVVGVSLAGFTPGKALLGLRVVRVDGVAMVGPLRALARTAMVALIVPAAITNSDGRGIHDRLTGTIEVRSR